MSESTSSERYADEATALDVQLDRQLAEIRRQTDAGELTLRQAADDRVQALETHIRAIKALRSRYFGETGD